MGLRQLNQLFDIYSRSLKVIDPRAGDAFVCPVCLRDFGRDDIESRNLSAEHVPPKSVGYALTTLTCRQCNNKVGSRLQHQMKRYVLQKDLLAGRVPKEGIPARVEIGGSTWSFVITEVPGKRRMTGFSLASHVSPKLWLSDPKAYVGKQALLSPRLHYSQDAVSAAYLQAAYLALFHLMGYPYILQPALRPIREKIASFSTKGGIPHVVQLPGLFMDPRSREIEIGVLWQTTDVLCLAVVVAGEVVLMPLVNDSYVRIFGVLDELFRKARKGKGERPSLGMARLLVDPAVKFSAGFRFERAEPTNGAATLRIVPIDHN